MNKQNLLSLAKGFAKNKRISYDKRIMHPVRDWLIGLSCFFTLVIAGGAYSAHQFITYRNLNIYEGSLNEQTVKYNEVLVERVLGEYAKREEAYQALQTVEIGVQAPEEEGATSTEPAVDQTGTSTEAVQEETPQPVLES